VSQTRQILDFVVDTAAAGDTQLVAAPTNGRQIRVLSYTLVAAGAVTARLRSAAANKSGAMSLAVSAPVSPSNSKALFTCAQNEALVLNLGGAVQVSGHGSYELI
jgi:hypothetical protein